MIAKKEQDCSYQVVNKYWSFGSLLLFLQMTMADVTDVEICLKIVKLMGLRSYFAEKNSLN